MIKGLISTAAGAAGSVGGAAIMTGLGFVVGGPVGAAVGFASGLAGGATGGAVAGNKLGKLVEESNK